METNKYGEQLCDLSDLPVTGCDHCQTGTTTLGPMHQDWMAE